MLKAGSLTYAIFLAVVTSILCSLMILLAYMNRSYFVQVDRNEVVRDNANSGIAIGMASASNLDFEEWIDLFDTGGDSVLLKRRRWGVYHTIFSKAVKQGQVYQKAAVAGYSNSLLENTALWLTDHNRPLQITGNALLKGQCYLPRKGIERAYVEGKNYEQDQLIYGRQRPSGHNLVQVDEKLDDYWLDYLNRSFNVLDSVVSFEQLPLKVEQSFAKKTLVAYSRHPVDLSGFQISGNVILISGTEITIPASGYIKDAVLIAPKIYVEKDVKMTAQLVATDTVELKTGSFLQYPSSVLLVYRKPGKNPFLKMHNTSQLYGSVVGYSNTSERTNDLSMEIAGEAKIKGLVYSEGNLELHGKVSGTVICNKLLLATPSGIYENHLLDGEVNRSGLPNGFASVALDDFDNYSIIASWLGY